MRQITTTLSVFATIGLVAAIYFNAVEKPLSSPEGLAIMQEAALDFLNSLDDEQRARAVFPFSSDERMNWNFVPMPGRRNGLKMKDMSAEQREAVHGLLQSALSAQGYLKATSILQLERILGEMENNPVYRDPEQYFVTVFGDPSAESPWGWRFEGHHLSLNFSTVEAELSVTPAFWGSNPAKVPEGPYAGWRVLHAEIDLARALMATFTEEQLEKVLIAIEAPRDIITGNSREAHLDAREGLAYADMTDEQRGLLRALVETYAHNLKHDVAHGQLERIEAAGIDELRFAWAGSREEGAGHYYRIHGPVTLIEYDNTQNNANHIHTTWRDLTDDFGRDLLREHYEQSGPDHGHDE